MRELSLSHSNFYQQTVNTYVQNKHNFIKMSRFYSSLTPWSSLTPRGSLTPKETPRLKNCIVPRGVQGVMGFVGIPNYTGQKHPPHYF